VKKKRLYLSIDLPSSEMPISTNRRENFQADLTVTFTAPKLAMFFPPAVEFQQRACRCEYRLAAGID